MHARKGTYPAIKPTTKPRKAAKAFAFVNLQTLAALTRAQTTALIMALQGYFYGCLAAKETFGWTRDRVEELIAGFGQLPGRGWTDLDVALVQLLPRMSYTVPENGRERATLIRAMARLSLLPEATEEALDACHNQFRTQDVVDAVRAIVNPEPPVVTDQSKIVGHLEDLVLGQQIQIGTFVVERADLDLEGFSTTYGKFPTAEAMADWLLDTAPKSPILAQPFRDFIDHGPGDAECTSCHRMFWSGQGHPDQPLCRACWKPQGRVSASGQGNGTALVLTLTRHPEPDHHAERAVVAWEADHGPDALDFTAAPLPEGHRPRPSSKFPQVDQTPDPFQRFVLADQTPDPFQRFVLADLLKAALHNAGCGGKRTAVRFALAQLSRKELEMLSKLTDRFLKGTLDPLEDESH